MLIYQAQTGRNVQLFSDFQAAKIWVERNSEGSMWKQSTPDSWILNSDSTGYQVGAIWAHIVETIGETDPLRQLAFAILSNDPMACDAARDVLKC